MLKNKKKGIQGKAMGRIVAISSGELDTTHKINEFIVNMVPKTDKNLLFIGTASWDDADYISEIHHEFEPLGCTVRKLYLAEKPDTEAEIEEKLNWADIIYVGGGETYYMMEVWKKLGIDHKLAAIYEEDSAVLCGISAGAMCWFLYGHSNSDIFLKDNPEGYGWVNDLLCIHPFAFGPHYDERRESFDRMLKEKDIPGLALEVDTAFVDDNGRISYISSNPGSSVYFVIYEDGQLKKYKQAVTLL